MKIGSTIEGGEFFDGDNLTVNLLAEWRPSKHFLAGLQWLINDVDLPGGNFITRLAQLRVNVAFNADWSRLNLVQYDNVTDTIGLNSRLRWIPRAGREAFLVFNDGWDVDDATSSVVVTRREIIIKLETTFRF